MGKYNNDFLNKFSKEFLEIADHIINHDKYQEMKEIKHHNESVYEHCMDTAYMSFKIAKKFNLDYVSIVRGGLLHDFYLYKFKRTSKYSLIKDSFSHANDHPKIAAKNAIKHFTLNEKEIDIIENHMFPAGLPKSKEAWIVTSVDKILAVSEYTIRLKNFYLKKIRRAETVA